MQALERRHPDVPMGPGRVQSREFEYVRHGTLCLMANLEVWCGQIIAPSIGPTRTEQDFKAHVEQTVNTDPMARWVFIVDNLDTHQSESLVLYVAQPGLFITRSELGWCPMGVDRLGKRSIRGVTRRGRSSRQPSPGFSAGNSHARSFLSGFAPASRSCSCTS